MYGFLLMFNIYIWPNSATLRDIRYQNVSDLDIDLPRSLKVKCNCNNGIHMYALILIFNSNICPNPAPLQDIRLWNLSDLDFEITRSLKVKCDGVIGLSRYIFYWYIQNNHMSISHRLLSRAIWNVVSYLLSLGPNYEKSPVHQMTSKWIWMIQGQRYSIYVELLQASPNFTSFCSTICYDSYNRFNSN